MKYDVYIPGQQVNQAQQNLEAHKGKKPGEYVSPWEDSLQKLLDQLNSREPFRYDPSKDPLYRQAVDRYVRLGRQAMMDTMGKAAGLTGGYANSYAENAGQQSYQNYLLALSARLPEFQQMALDRYQAAGKDLLDKYQVLSQQDKAGYDRYQDAVNHYYGELDRLQNAYDRLHDREYGAFVADRNFHYAREQDEKKAAWQAQQAQREQARFELQQAYQKERDKIRDEQWRQDFEESRRRYELDLQLRQAAAAAAARRGSGGSRGSGRGSCQKPRPGGGPLGRFSRDEYYGWRNSASHTGSRFTQAPAGGRFSR